MIVGLFFASITLSVAVFRRSEELALSRMAKGSPAHPAQR
jgi:hypothetical protein